MHSPFIFNMVINYCMDAMTVWRRYTNTASNDLCDANFNFFHLLYQMLWGSGAFAKSYD